MAATITTTLKDNSKEWVDALKKRFTEAGGSAEEFEKHLEDVTKELQSREAQKQAGEIKKLADELDGSAAKAAKVDKSLEDLNRELASREAQEQARRIRELADAMDGTAAKAAELVRQENEASAALDRAHQAAIGNSQALRQLDEATHQAAIEAGTLGEYHQDLQRILDERKVRAYRVELEKLADAMSPAGPQGFSKSMGALRGSIMPVVASVFAMQQGLKSAWEAVRFLSERGVPAFQRLEAAGQKVFEALIESANDPQLTKTIDRLAFVIEKSLVPGIAESTSLMGKLYEVSEKSWRVLLAIQTLGLSEYKIRQMDKEIEKTKELAKARADAAAEEQAEAEERLRRHLAQEQRNAEAGGLRRNLDDRRSGVKQDREIDKFKDSNVGQIDAAIQERLALFNAAVEEMRVTDGAVHDRMRARAEQLSDEIVTLETTRQSVIDKAAEKEKEKARELAEYKRALQQETFSAELSMIDALLTQQKSGQESAMALETKKQALIEKNSKLTTDPAERRANETEIKQLNELIKKEKARAEAIEELEKKRERLIEENRKKERDLAKEQGNLEQVLHEQELARIKEKADKEIEAALLKIHLEEEVDKVKKQKQADEEAAHQKKVGQLKELLTLQGQPIPGAGQGQGPGGQPPMSLVDQLKQMITPKKVQKQVIKNREDKAVEEYEKEKKQFGEMDDEGNLVDIYGEFDKLSPKERERRLKARKRADVTKLRGKARAGAQKEMNTGTLSNEEFANAQGDLLAGISENLISKGNLGKEMIDAIRQVVEEISSQNQLNANLQDQLNNIKKALAGLQSGNGGHGGSF